VGELNSSDIKQVLSSGDYGGVNPLQALENIKRRCQEKKERRNSDLKTALILQGGGMRGVFGAGVCCALEELGYTEGFDEIYGVSAGALNGAYFLSGQAAYGTTIYYQDINNRGFINFFRFRKIVDIDFLMNIIVKVKPLNFKKLLDSSTTLNIGLTCVSTGKAVMFKNKQRDVDILALLKATAAMPFVYDIPVNIQGTWYLDGGISCPIPVKEAIEAGCTDILVVLTRPKNYKPGSFEKIFDRFLIEPGIKKYGENFCRVYKNRYKLYEERLRIVKGEQKHKNVNILAIFPAESIKVKRMTKRESILKNTAIEGATKTLRLFGIPDPFPVEVLKFLSYR